MKFGALCTPEPISIQSNIHNAMKIWAVKNIFFFNWIDSIYHVIFFITYVHNFVDKIQYWNFLFNSSSIILLILYFLTFRLINDWKLNMELPTSGQLIILLTCLLTKIFTSLLLNNYPFFYLWFVQYSMSQIGWTFNLFKESNKNRWKIFNSSCTKSNIFFVFIIGVFCWADTNVIELNVMT